MKLIATITTALLCAVQQPAAADCLDTASAGLRTPGGRLAASFTPSIVDGRTALKASPKAAGTDALVILPLGDIVDGEITLRLRSELRPDASPDARGFAGLAFRVAGDARAFEYFYVRPANARASSQVRRNHSLQYASHPDHPWEVLRKAEPEKYESYADMALGEWITLRAVVRGRSAQFYVNGAQQPSLVVEDLKLAPAAGSVGLWVGPGTVAHFADVCVLRRDGLDPRT